MHIHSDKQARVPPLHIGLVRAFKRDYLQDSHPSTKVFIRAYAFGYAAQTLPSLAKLIVATFLALYKGKRRSLEIADHFTRTVVRILRSGLRSRGLALFFGSGLAGAVWLDALLQRQLLRFAASYKQSLTSRLHNPTDKLSDAHRAKLRYTSTFLSTFIASLAAIYFHASRQRRGKPGPTSKLPLVTAASTIINGKDPLAPFISQYQSSTLDFTLFLFVRATDTALRAAYAKVGAGTSTVVDFIANAGDTLLFVASSWRIMFIWFYRPELLPASYNRWIHSLARIDERLLELLRYARAGEWVYGLIPLTAESQKVGAGLCQSMGWSAEDGMPDKIAAFPCEIVHGDWVGSASCEYNIAKRWATAFVQSFALYTPVHMLPLLLFATQNIRRAPVQVLLRGLKGAARSSAFLGTFVAAVWTGVCMGRTRLGPAIIRDQQKWDGGLAMLLGTFLCGWSVLIENKRRRGEMALFVAPRALYTVLPDILPASVLSSKRLSAAAERTIFALSTAGIMSAAVHQPKYLRGIVHSISRMLVGSWDEHVV